MNSGQWHVGQTVWLVSHGWRIMAEGPFKVARVSKGGVWLEDGRRFKLNGKEYGVDHGRFTFGAVLQPEGQTLLNSLREQRERDSLRELAAKMGLRTDAWFETIEQHYAEITEMMAKHKAEFCQEKGNG